MKILIANDLNKSAHAYERWSLAQAFVDCGHECTIWDIKKKSEYDALDEFEPDILIGQTYNITKALINCRKERPALKIILKAGDYGPMNEYNKVNYPHISFASKEEIKNTEKLNPNFLFIHHHPDYIEDTHGYWMKDYKVHSLMTASNLFSFTNGTPKERFKSQLGYLGGYWKYKALTLDQFILPLCSDFNYNFKIFGNLPWPCPQYCGVLPDGQEKDFMSSCDINLNMHEKHAQDLGYDLVERTFKLATNKSFFISDYVEGLEKLFGDSVVMAKTPKEYKAKIDHFLNNPQDKNKHIKEMLQKVVANHTYFDRAKDIFKYLNFDYKHIDDRKLERCQSMNLI